MPIFWVLFILWCAFFVVYDASVDSWGWASFQLAFMIFGIIMLVRDLS